ncbi:MAG: dihydrodipicolinate synthase family protein [Eubacteriales bacterium]|nr:dihydrodipicolinate synthase family protein [Eubacteriales bacterium]
MKSKLRGIFVPAVTPFDNEESVDVRRMKKIWEKWRETDLSGMMVLGTNGESRQLSDRESLLVVEAAIEYKGDKTLIVGAGRESLRTTLDFMTSLAQFREGIDYLSIMTPSFFAKQMTDQALYRYYDTLAECSPIPILLYMAPSYANGVTISPELAAALADHPNVAGIKDTSPDQMEALMAKAGGREDFSVLAGSVNNLMRCLDLGGPGGVVSAANYFPEECAEITRRFFAGDTEGARAAYDRLLPLVRCTGGSRGIASLKACMGLLCYDAGRPRLPVLPLTNEEINEMDKRLHQADKL